MGPPSTGVPEDPLIYFVVFCDESAVWERTTKAESRRTDSDVAIINGSLPDS